MNVEKELSLRIGMAEIRQMVAWAMESEKNLSRLWEIVSSDNRLASYNALWVISHLPESADKWIRGLRDEMTDMLLAETDTGKKRLLLCILRKQEYAKDEVRADLLDFCMDKINSECEPYAIRCFSLYAAFKMCIHFPELLAELEQHLQMMEYQSLSPGLLSALRQTKRRISRLKKTSIHETNKI